jgi:hypothetical protein
MNHCSFVKSETTHRDKQKREYFSPRGLLAHYAAMSSLSPQDPSDAHTDARSAPAVAWLQVSHIAPPIAADSAAAGGPAQREIGGREGPEPTRFGDWEKNGRCIDF